MALAALGLAFAHVEPWQVVVGYLVSGAGSGLALGAIPNLVIAAVPPQQQGVTAGVVNLVQSLGSSAGVQIIFIVLTLDVVTVAAGQPIYAGSSYAIAFILVAALSVLALLATAAADRNRRSHRRATTGRLPVLPEARRDLAARQRHGPGPIIGDLLGKVTRSTGGKGASVPHWADASLGIMDEGATLGSAFPVAAGAALSS